ncbi:MAG: DUF6503 family protein [Saonia sp.]
MINRILLLILCTTLFCCKHIDSKKPDVQNIVDGAIEVSGGVLYTNSDITFVSRDILYQYGRKEGKRILSRSFSKDSTKIRDVMGPDEFKRYVNDSLVFVPDSMATKYSNSINSVHYFAYLPYGLNDKAVNKEFLGEVTIKEDAYYKIRVTFDEAGGGDDFEDVFMYWFNKSTLKPDYLAYRFFVNGGGVRFREAFNERYINGIRFVDYKNYRPNGDNPEVEQLDKAFENDNLELISEITLSEIEVKR